MTELPLMNRCRQAISGLGSGDTVAAKNLLHRLMHEVPAAPETQFLKAAVAYHVKDLAAARQAIAIAVATDGNRAEFHHLRGLILADSDAPAEAAEAFDALARLCPDNADARYNQGLALEADDRTALAKTAYEKAIDLKPGHLEARRKLARLLSAAGHIDAALSHFRFAAAAHPESAGFCLDMAHACQKQGRTREAIACYQHLLRLADTSEIHNNIGALYQIEGDFEAAFFHFRRALALKPNFLQAACNLGNALLDSGRIEEGIAHLEALVEQAPAFVEAHRAIGHGYQRQGHLDAARRSYEIAVSLRPDAAEGYNGLGVVFSAMGRLDLAEANYRRAISRDPSSAGACNNLGNVLSRQGQVEEALSLYDKAIQIDPDFAEPYANALSPLLESCEWDRIESFSARLMELNCRQPGNGIFALEGPLVSLQRHNDPARHHKITRFRSESVARSVPRSEAAFAFHGRRHKSGPLTIGYLSGNFNRHPVAIQMGGLFRCHDRNRFRILCFATSPDDGSDIRKQIQGESDEFRNIAPLDHGQAARTIYNDGVDILIDLMGHTRGNRLEIAARRPAPVIVSYLGFLATTGAAFIDYLICDRIVVPPSHAPHYSEKLVYLPHSYQINDDRLKISSRTFTPKEAGLPDGRFVFCSFNNPAKIDPVIFDAWMTILRQVDQSVLWLQGGNDHARKNLRREACRRGVDPDRLIHAPTLPLSDHLARLKLAHLALDTRIYNGGATTSNALWAGIPVITAPGSDFVSRMTASALSAMGLADLVCPDMDAYIRLATDLAGHRNRLKSVRQRVQTNRSTSPFFDTRRFVRNLEQAYLRMWEIFREGLPPQPIQVQEHKDKETIP